MHRLLAVIGLGLTAWGPGTHAQGVGFLTEQQRLASYCAGVSEARMLEMNDFLKAQCTGGSTRKECRDTTEALAQAKIRDRRLWDYLTRQIFTSREQGSRERALAQKAIAKGNGDWLACKLRDPTRRPEDLLVCRESQGCLIDARFGFLDQ
ncbi:MAG: hypothetical protein JSS04_19800 [Proteobacteria bacterium]|nr:hypothetical protein [Pseudomonadota bacterium]